MRQMGLAVGWIVVRHTTSGSQKRGVTDTYRGSPMHKQVARDRLLVVGLTLDGGLLSEVSNHKSSGDLDIHKENWAIWKCKKGKGKKK